MLEKTVPEMLIGCLKYDEKLPYLHKITKQKFLVSNTNMGLCLYMLLDSHMKLFLCGEPQQWLVL